MFWSFKKECFDGEEVNDVSRWNSDCGVGLKRILVRTQKFRQKRDKCHPSHVEPFRNFIVHSEAKGNVKLFVNTRSKVECQQRSRGRLRSPLQHRIALRVLHIGASPVSVSVVASTAFLRIAAREELRQWAAHHSRQPGAWASFLKK